MESLVISTGLILDMEIKESQKPTSLQNWGGGGGGGDSSSFTYIYILLSLSLIILVLC